MLPRTKPPHARLDFRANTLLNSHLQKLKHVLRRQKGLLPGWRRCVALHNECCQSELTWLLHRSELDRVLGAVSCLQPILKPGSRLCFAPTV